MFANVDNRDLRRSEAGTALVELAMVAPLLALLLVGIIDFGRYTYDGVLAANAARAGVEYGAQNAWTAEDTTGQQNAAYADAQNLSGMTATASPPFCMLDGATVSCGTSGAVYYVKVTTTGTFTPIFKYVGLPTQVPVTGSAVMAVEDQ
jgi:Flp pilus assembly protein TadG